MCVVKLYLLVLLCVRGVIVCCSAALEWRVVCLGIACVTASLLFLDPHSVVCRRLVSNCNVCCLTAILFPLSYSFSLLVNCSRREVVLAVGTAL